MQITNSRHPKFKVNQLIGLSRLGLAALFTFYTALLASAAIPGSSVGQVTKARVVAKPAPLLTFKDWRAVSIQNALTRLNSTREQLSRAQNEVRLAIGLERARLSQRERALAKALEQAKFELQNAKNLKVSDYMAAYVSRLRLSQNTLSEISRRMTPVEVEELMRSYLAFLRSEREPLRIERP